MFPFLFGLCVGSFLNVLIYRLNTPGAPKFWQGRSFCPLCRHQLSWKDNIPLVSFFWLLGKCRYCHSPISWHYPAVEFLTAVVTYFIFISVPISGVTDVTGLLTLLSYLVLTYSLIVIFFSDLLYYLIPDEALLVAVLATFVSLILKTKYLIPERFGVGLLSSLALLLIVVLTRGKGLGLGDVKFAFLMGLFLGWPNILAAFWLAFVAGGLAAVTLLLLGRKKLKSTIPFGPFLVLGMVAAHFISALFWSILGM